MAAVVVALRNKRYDAQQAEGSKLNNNELLTSFPPENERKADMIIQKYMLDGYKPISFNIFLAFETY